MDPRVSRHAALGLGLATLIIWLPLLSSAFLAAQVTVSPGPPPLFQVKIMYIAASSNDFARLVKSRLEKWGVVRISSQVEEADAILMCQTESTIVPAKVVVRRMDAQVRLVDRRSQQVIWSTKKSTTSDSGLADEIVDQLKRDWERSVSDY